MLCEAEHVAEVCDLAVTVITASPHHPCNLRWSAVSQVPKDPPAGGGGGVKVSKTTVWGGKSGKVVRIKNKVNKM